MAHTDTFESAWRESFGRHALVAYELRVTFIDRWVRFHSLPESKRYPETEEEYAIVLERWNTVLADVLGSSPGWLVATHPNPADQAWLSSLLGECAALEEEALRTPRDLECWDLHLWRHQFLPGRLDVWLRRIADDEVVNTLFLDNRCSRLVAPYDGGIDVLLPSTAERDQLRARYGDWLSARDDGL